MQTRLFDDPDLVQLYDIENGWADDDRYCRELEPDPKDYVAKARAASSSAFSKFFDPWSLPTRRDGPDLAGPRLTDFAVYQREGCPGR
jgi:hypothetical protein